MASPVYDDELSETPHSGGIGLVAVEVKVDRSVLDVVYIALGDPVPIFTSFVPVAVFLALDPG